MLNLNLVKHDGFDKSFPQHDIEKTYLTTKLAAGKLRSIDSNKT